MMTILRNNMTKEKIWIGVMTSNLMKGIRKVKIMKKE